MMNLGRVVLGAWNTCCGSRTNALPNELLLILILVMMMMMLMMLMLMLLMLVMMILTTMVYRTVVSISCIQRSIF